MIYKDFIRKLNNTNKLLCYIVIIPHFTRVVGNAALDLKHTYVYVYIREHTLSAVSPTVLVQCGINNNYSVTK